MDSSYFFSFRHKLILAFFGIGFVLSIALGVVAHRILEEKLFTQLRGNVGNLTRLGAELIDKDALASLVELQKTGVPPENIDMIERSGNFRIVSDQLNFIRDTEKELIRYIYLVAPAEDPKIAKYVVDADVVPLKDEGAPDEEVSHFNTDLDIADFPVMQDALRHPKNIVEPDFVYDKAFGVNSISGYAPVMDSDGKTMLALLGLDMVDTEVQAALAEVLQKSIVAAILSLLVSLLSAIVLGSYLTKGIIRLDNLVHSFAAKDFAVRADLATNDEVGRLGNSFNHMAETIEEYSARKQALLHAYGRFVPHDLLRLLEKQSILDVSLGDQTQREMSVLFSDIRNFTSISETMTPRENFNFINSYLSRVGPGIRSHKGIIDKYIGDAVMALFPEKAEDAIDAALEMQQVVRLYNEHRQSSRYPAIKIGVGVHTGKVMLGTIGEEQRMDGTVISDTVNLASRIEGLTKTYGCNIIVSDTVLNRIGRQDKYSLRFIDKVRVVGKNEPVTLYEIYDADEAAEIRLKRETLPDYSRAVDSYYGRDFKTAESLFARVVAANGNDVPARLFLEKARACLSNGVPAGWDGISRYDSKG